jgi:septation ring formation regulator EzrA
MIGTDRQDFMIAAEIAGGVDSAWEEQKNRLSHLGAVLADARGYRAALPQVAQDLEAKMNRQMGRLRAEGVNPTAEVSRAASQANSAIAETSRIATVRPLDLERARTLAEQAAQAVSELEQTVERLIQEARTVRQALEQAAARVARSHRARHVLRDAESVFLANDFDRVIGLIQQAEAIAHQEELEEERRRQEAMRRAAAAAAAALLRNRRGGGGGFGGFGGSGNRGGSGGSNWGGGSRGGGNRGGTGGSNW